MAELILIRHAESTANVAREAAEAGGSEVIAVDARDADVALSARGHEQAQAVGRWLAGVSNVETVWSSPYRRARSTAEVALNAGDVAVPLRVDERLRDKELGILDTLTALGVQNRYPAEWQRRRWLGKFYYRAPGGESWADMTLRIRSFLSDIPARAISAVVTHDAMIMLFCYVCQQLDEAALLDLAAHVSIGNAAVTRLASDGSGAPWRVVTFNDERHLRTDAGDDLRTRHPGDPDVHPR